MFLLLIMDPLTLLFGKLRKDLKSLLLSQKTVDHFYKIIMLCILFLLLFCPPFKDI